MPPAFPSPRCQLSNLKGLTILIRARRESPRIPVATVVGMVGEAMADREILDTYPDLEIEDVREALRYAAEAVSTPGTQTDLRFFSPLQ
jgi:hypothetical protein